MISYPKIDQDSPLEKLPSYTSGQPADWMLIPTHMIGGVRRYIEHGLEPGDFLTAVLCNDLKEACYRADDINIDRLVDYVRFLYRYAPGRCWGSPEKYEKWIAHRGLAGIDDGSDD